MLQTKTRQISTLYPENIENLTQTYQYCEVIISLNNLVIALDLIHRFIKTGEGIDKAEE